MIVPVGQQPWFSGGNLPDWASNDVPIERPQAWVQNGWPAQQVTVSPAQQAAENAGMTHMSYRANTVLGYRAPKGGKAVWIPMIRALFAAETRCPSRQDFFMDGNDE